MSTSATAARRLEQRGETKSKAHARCGRQILARVGDRHRYPGHRRPDRCRLPNGAGAAARAGLSATTGEWQIATAMRTGGPTAGLAEGLAAAQRNLATFPKRTRQRTKRHRAAARKIAKLHGKIR